MIGGLVALALDKSVLRQLGEGRHTVVVTGTNGKSTTTRMTAALGTLGASEPEGRRHKLRSRKAGDIKLRSRKAGDINRRHQCRGREHGRRTGGRAGGRP